MHLFINSTNLSDPGVPSLGSRNGYNASLLPARYVVKPMLPLGSKRAVDSSSSNCFDATLLIKDTDLSDEREYTLFIENEKGRESKANCQRRGFNSECLI